MSRYGPPTKTMYCVNPACIHALGIEIKWYPDSMDGPGGPYSDCCPACERDLRMEPPDEDEEEDEEE